MGKRNNKLCWFVNEYLKKEKKMYFLLLSFALKYIKIKKYYNIKRKIQSTYEHQFYFILQKSTDTYR